MKSYIVLIPTYHYYNKIRRISGRALLLQPNGPIFELPLAKINIILFKKFICSRVQIVIKRGTYC